MNTLTRIKELSGISESAEKRSEEEYEVREKMFAAIESYFGTLESLNWSELSTEDMAKMYEKLLADKLIKSRNVRDYQKFYNK